MLADMSNDYNSYQIFKGCRPITERHKKLLNSQWWCHRLLWPLSGSICESVALWQPTNARAFNVGLNKNSSHQMPFFAIYGRHFMYWHFSKTLLTSVLFSVARPGPSYTQQIHWKCCVQVPHLTWKIWSLHASISYNATFYSGLGADSIVDSLALCPFNSNNVTWWNLSTHGLLFWAVYRYSSCSSSAAFLTLQRLKAVPRGHNTSHCEGTLVITCCQIQWNLKLYLFFWPLGGNTTSSHSDTDILSLYKVAIVNNAFLIPLCFIQMPKVPFCVCGQCTKSFL